MLQSISISFYIYINVYMVNGKCIAWSRYRYNVIQILIWIGIDENKGALCILNSDDAPLTFECSCFKFSHTLIYTSSALPFIHFSYFRIHHVGQLHLATYMHARKHVLYSIACKFCRSSSISHTHMHTISPHRYHINTILSFLDTQITDLVGYSHLCKIFSLI